MLLSELVIVSKRISTLIHLFLIASTASTLAQDILTSSRDDCGSLLTGFSINILAPISILARARAVNVFVRSKPYKACLERFKGS